MKHLSRVAWQEGMYLSPHHFQAQSRYYEETIGFSVAAVAGWGYGFTTCEFETEVLRNGTLRLLRARGVFPDGTPFDMPDQDEFPPSRKLADIYDPAGLDICLALPARRSGGNFAESPDRTVRFEPVSVQMPDETLGRGEAEIFLGRKNLRLLTAKEASETEGAYGPRWTWLPAARIIRDGSGVFVFDPDFVPAAMRVAAGARMVQITKALLATLEERAAGALREHGGPNRKWGTSGRDVMQFWFLHTLNTTIAKLSHLLTKNCHPAELYLEMSRAAGALCTFTSDSSPSSLPLYDPLKPGLSIAALDAHIRRHLEISFPTSSLRVPLKPVSPGFWEGSLQDARLTGRGSWFIGVRSSARIEETIGAVPDFVKICSARWVGKLVDRQLPGMKLQHMTVPPPGCSPLREFQYFSVERSGPCWQDVSGTKTVGIYVPATLPDAELDLVAMPE